MADRNADEKRVYGVVFGALKRFIDAAREKVMAPFRSWGGNPDPTGVYQVQSVWTDEIDTILTVLGQISMGAWSEATDVPPVSRHAFVMSQLAQTQNFLVGIPDEVYNIVFAELTDGVNAGESIDQLAKRVDGVLETSGSERWQNRARNIAVTETTRAYGAGTLAAGLEQSRVTGRLLQKRWDTEHDKRVRASHRAVDGVVTGLSQPFNIGGFPLLFPGDPMGPADEVCGCVPGSSLVSVSNVRVAYRFQWEGPVFTLTREGGTQTTVSPYHPVLTELGWIPACELKQGSNIITARCLDALPGLCPDVDRKPTMAKEVYDSLTLSGEPQGVSELAMNFYGDRPRGKVDVVTSNGKLSFGLDSETEKDFLQLGFSCSDALSAAESQEFKFTPSLFATGGGLMCFTDLIGALQERHTLPLQSLGLTSTSGLDARPSQSQIDGPSSDTKTLSETINRFTVNVTIDKIIDVDTHPFSGHLYTFQSDSGIYLVDGIVSRNCRCDLTIVNEGAR